MSGCARDESTDMSTSLGAAVTSPKPHSFTAALIPVDGGEQDQGDRNSEERMRLLKSPAATQSKIVGQAHYRTLIICLIALMIALELEESVQAPPTVRLLEMSICQRHLNTTTELPIDESQCKTGSVQAKLAHIRGLQAFFDAIPTLLFSIPYGYAADRYGRRIVFFLSGSGLIFALGWIYLICSNWHIFPTEFVWLSAAFRIIGGGPNIAFAMIMTMATDITTEDDRSKILYFTFCAYLCTGLVGPRIASLSMERGLWLSYLICAISLACSFPVLILMPETLHYSRKQNQEQYTGIVEQSWGGRIASIASVYRRIFRDRRIVIGLVCVFLVQMRTVAVDLLLPYVSYRLKWKLEETAALLSVIYAVNIAMFLLVLPLGNRIMAKRSSWLATSVDLFVTRGSQLLLAAGSLGIAMSTSTHLLLVGLVVFASGFGARIAMVSVLTAFIDASITARLYTFMSIIEELARLVGSPIIQAFWSLGISWGGVSLGLPYFVLAAIFLVAFIASVVGIRVDAGYQIVDRPSMVA